MLIYIRVTKMSRISMKVSNIYRTFSRFHSYLTDTHLHTKERKGLVHDRANKISQHSVKCRKQEKP